MNEALPYLVIVGFALVLLFLVSLTNRATRIERKLAVLMRFMHVDLNQAVPLSDAVRELAKAGQKIQAIKLHRDETGAGLKEAKDAVEEYLAAAE